MATVATVAVVAVVALQVDRRRDTTCHSSVVARAHAEEDRLELREGLHPCDLCHRALGAAAAAVGLGANPSTCTWWGLSGILCSWVRRAPVAVVAAPVAAVPVVAEERGILGWKRFQGC